MSSPHTTITACQIGNLGNQLAGRGLPTRPRFQPFAREPRGDRPLDCDLAWRRDGADWVLLYKRRRMGRVLPDNQHHGMYRSVLSRGHLSDMANLSWAKGAVLAAAIRELAWEAGHPAINPAKCPERGVFYGLSPTRCKNGG
jgi:hypothetical protein